MWNEKVATNNPPMLSFIKILNDAKSGGWLISLKQNTAKTCNGLIVIAIPIIYKHLNNFPLKDNKEISNAAQ